MLFAKRKYQKFSAKQRGLQSYSDVFSDLPTILLILEFFSDLYKNNK